jgi:NAD(P)-dependent dehydrogenase (short-subunit alcohol dehydrogenase family)
MGVIAVTGSASGMGRATAERLRAAGHRVIGVDRANADIVADLGSADGRQAAIAGVLDACGGTLDGLTTFAGLPGLTDRAGSVLVEVNYLGTIELLTGLRPALARGTNASAVAISSNSTTCQPGIPQSFVKALIDGDYDEARALGDQHGSVIAYPATKTAIAWWVRRNATTADWIGNGINLNAVAPGLVATPLTDATRADPVIGVMMDQFPVPVGRPGAPEELATFVSYLLSPEARFFVGSVVFVDGGTDALLRPDDVPVNWHPKP